MSLGRAVQSLKLFALMALAPLMAAPAWADPIIYNNGGPNSLSGNEATQWIQADDFTLDTAFILTDIHFWAFDCTIGCDVDEPPYQGSVFYRIYGDVGVPDESNILSQGLVIPTRAFDHNTPFGPSFSYDFDIAPLALAPGTYWLGIHNGPLSITDRLEWYWETTALNATSRGEEDETPFDVGGWFSNGNEHAFYLTGRMDEVPEPATLLLVGIGLAGFSRTRLRQRR